MYKQIDHNTQVKYIESFIIDKNPVIKKPKSTKDKYYLLDCPKCSKRSAIYMSQSRDNISLNVSQRVYVTIIDVV